MSAKGSLVTHTYTSDAQIPLPGSTVTVTQPGADGKQRLLAVRISNYDGFTSPVFIDTPDFSESQQFQENGKPYSTVDLEIEHVSYDRIIVRNVQIFPDTQSLQELMLVPTPTLPESYNRTEVIVIPDQNL